MARGRAGRSSPSKTKRYTAGKSTAERNKERKKKKWERERERWANDKEYQAKQKERAIKLRRISV